MSSMQCAVFSVYSVQYAVCCVHCVWCAVCSVQGLVLWCAVCCVYCSVCAVCNMQCAGLRWYSVYCLVCSVCSVNFCKRAAVAPVSFIGPVLAVFITIAPGYCIFGIPDACKTKHTNDREKEKILHKDNSNQKNRYFFY